LKPLLSLALQGTVGSTAPTGDAKSGASNTPNQRSKSNPSHVGYLNSSSQAIVAKGPSDVEDEHPFVRLDERDSHSLNEDYGSGHELSDLGHNGIVITTEFKLDSD
jgi:hypothetical protein